MAFHMTIIWWNFWIGRILADNSMGINDTGKKLTMILENGDCLIAQFVEIFKFDVDLANGLTFGTGDVHCLLGVH